MYFLRKTSQQFQSVAKACTKLTKNIPLNLARSPLKDIKSNRNLSHLSRTTTFNFNLLETHLHKICWHVRPMPVLFSLPRLLYPFAPCFRIDPDECQERLVRSSRIARDPGCTFRAQPPCGKLRSHLRSTAMPANDLGLARIRRSLGDRAIDATATASRCNCSRGNWIRTGSHVFPV